MIQVGYRLLGIDRYPNKSQKDLYEKHHNTADGRIRIWFGLRQIMNATDRLLLETRDAAQELNTGIHMHIAEIPYENQLVMRTKKIDHGTVTYLEKIDFLRSNLLAAHSVWLNESEISHFSNAGVKVSHCPASAMRMLGFAPIREMLDSGVCVSLGTDGAPSNNRMSIVDEMYLASLINKGREAYISGTTDPTVLPSETVLTMATINGAKAVLWDNEIGSLEVGKKADLIVVNPFKWSMVPLHDSIANIVYCMRSENIESVMCNGQWIMKDQKIMNVNELRYIIDGASAASNISFCGPGGGENKDNDPSKKDPAVKLEPKTFVRGSGSIIGKCFIQEFFTCTRALVNNDEPILKRTNSYAQVISALIVSLARRFIRTHPSLQRWCLELHVINCPRAKKVATIALMHEFDYIIHEAIKIFDHYEVNYESPIIDDIIFDEDLMQRYRSRDHLAFEENARKEVPKLYLIQQVFNGINKRYSSILQGNKDGYDEECLDRAKVLIDDAFLIVYERSLDDQISEKSNLEKIKVMKDSVFHYLSSPSRKFIGEKGESLISAYDDIIYKNVMDNMKELDVKDDNTS
ncbi:5-methylthioadenosine/S-adenosylhomocysteine deaminase [Hordeum vulgare]|nr:5-methylthioadenosine/S-adenosylhomocysteine deaminase [Hordeum vulgare]